MIQIQTIRIQSNKMKESINNPPKCLLDALINLVIFSIRSRMIKRKMIENIAKQN